MKLEKLKEFPRDNVLLLLTILTFIPFFILTIIFIINEFSLITSTSYGVLDFELAWKPEMINKIFTAWGPVQMENQIIIHYLDYIYPPIYALFGAEYILIISRKLEGKTQKLGLYITFSTIIAGVFDALENINLLLMLNEEAFINSTSPFFASFCAVIKIGFLIISLCYFYIALILLILKKEAVKKEYQYIVLFGGAILICGLLSLWNLFLSLYIGVIYFFMLLVIINFNSKNNN
jgi:hypothetical protein